MFFSDNFLNKICDKTVEDDSLFYHSSFLDDFSDINSVVYVDLLLYCMTMSTLVNCIIC